MMFFWTQTARALLVADPAAGIRGSHFGDMGAGVNIAL
jgi:hypothetical protein